MADFRVNHRRFARYNGVDKILFVGSKRYADRVVAQLHVEQGRVMGYLARATPMPVPMYPAFFPYDLDIGAQWVGMVAQRHPVGVTEICLEAIQHVPQPRVQFRKVAGSRHLDRSAALGVQNELGYIEHMGPPVCDDALTGVATTHPSGTAQRFGWMHPVHRVGVFRRGSKPHSVIEFRGNWRGCRTAAGHVRFGYAHIKMRYGAEIAVARQFRDAVHVRMGTAFCIRAKHHALLFHGIREKTAFGNGKRQGFLARHMLPRPDRRKRNGHMPMVGR